MLTGKLYPRSVYKPRSVGVGLHPAIISLGHTLPCGSSDLPGATVTKTGKRAASRPTRLLPGERALLLLGLAPDGGCLAVALLRAPVVSYTTFSPLPVTW